MSTIKVEGRLNRIIFQSQENDFKILLFRLSKNSRKTFDNVPDIVIKGNMELIENTDYIFVGELVEDKRYGTQYELLDLKRTNPIEEMDNKAFKDFLLTFVSNQRVKDIYETLDDPVKTFVEGNIDELMSVHNIGKSIAQKYLEVFESQKDYGQLYAEFSKWNFTTQFARKVAKAKKSVDKAIKTLNENPYDLMGISGVGFKTIDAKALEHGIVPNDSRRVKAFIAEYFNELAMDGHSWISLSDLMEYLKEEIFECDLRFTLDYIQNSGDFVIYTQDNQKRVAAKNVFEIEHKIAKELLRIMLAPSNLDLKNTTSIIEDVEKKQGWKYSEEQNKAIHKMLDYNVFLLQGLAGTGKSSVVNAFVQVMNKNNYNYKQCALSGKAAQNLASITGEEGSTIHRLLGYGMQGFAYNINNKLPTYAVILDEISMVDINIFYQLLVAIPNGAKLIMIGDSGQLDSIGVGVMNEMINSKVIPSMTLKDIHRQAKKSAMITHSISFRNGKYPKELQTKAGTRKIYGENKDLGYTFLDYKDEHKIKFETMKIYQFLVKKYGVKDTQIIVPTISAGSANCEVLNEYCQKMVNPADKNKTEVLIKKSKDYSYILREGDKVINVKNNRSTKNVNGEEIPIFNGNTGIIDRIVLNDDGDLLKMIVNFDSLGHIELSLKDVKSLNLGYAITVHKSQGSTLDCVIVALPFQFKLDSRELLYTAITRAAKMSYIVTSPKTLKFTIGKTSKKTHRNNLASLLRIESKQILKKRKEVIQ